MAKAPFTPPAARKPPVAAATATTPAPKPKPKPKPKAAPATKPKPAGKEPLTEFHALPGLPAPWADEGCESCGGTGIAADFSVCPDCYGAILSNGNPDGVLLPSECEFWVDEETSSWRFEPLAEEEEPEEEEPEPAPKAKAKPKPAPKPAPAQEPAKAAQEPASEAPTLTLVLGGTYTGPRETVRLETLVEEIRQPRNWGGEYWEENTWDRRGVLADNLPQILGDVPVGAVLTCSGLDHECQLLLARIMGLPNVEVIQAAK